MQLKLRVVKDWRSVVVTLTDGCWPSVDGCLLSELAPEPAVWFKVAVLKCVSIDCAQRVISWNFISKDSRQCCLMAPHEGDTPPSWMDELACVFELAETLFEAGSTASVNMRRLKVEQRTWARLLQSFILPLVNFVASDLPSLEEALSFQTAVLSDLDTTISNIVAQTTEVKRQLTELRTSFLPAVLDWARAGQVSRLFLEHVIADIKKIENKTRSKIESFSLSQRCSSVTGTMLVNAGDSAASEQLLMDMLTLRSQLVECLLTTDKGEKKMTENQEQYLSLHKKLISLRESGTTTSNRKVLALRVRECLQQAVSNGGTSHPRLQPHDHLSTSSYQTSSDKLNIVLSMPSTIVAVTHHQFCSEFRSTWFEEFVVVEVPSVGSPHSPQADRLEGGVNRPLLLRSVKRHVDRMLDVIADHFGNRDTDFSQQMQLAYEKVFFDMFHQDLMAMYSESERKTVERLQLNALGAALLSPDPSLPPAIGALFPSLGFEHIMQRYQDIKGNATPLPWQQACSQDYIEHFGGLIFDLERLLQVHSPLEKLQLLTSAFRKLMASLSALQDKVVCCDDLLPVMVGALLQASPKLLADIHINTIFLNDFIAPFLSSGWHGYSLTFFSSAVRIISEI